MKISLELLQNSPFFEVFPSEHLERMATHARVKYFKPGEVLFEQDSPAEKLYLLADGKIRLTFHTLGIGRASEEVVISLMSEPGRLVGWSAMVEPYRYRAKATALESTRTLSFDRNFLEQYCCQWPDFGVQFARQILWVAGNRLRATRIRLIAHHYEAEVEAIRTLLKQNEGRLSVSSPLHKIPHYLENRLTLADAIHCLELLQGQGDATERRLAGSWMEILESVRREMIVFRHLQAIYETVANAAPNTSPSEIRNRCCQEFIALFEDTKHTIQGQENLPDHPGHIFIMNHLSNHPDNLLPNDFHLTLDTHFVSAMILHKKYGEAPIRVIRKSLLGEHGHQQYYDRLGYIYVSSGAVDEGEPEANISPEERRRLFLDHARSHLLARRNIVICPEGNSTETDRSPLPFRPGAFRLAAYVRPEPLIVPIAVAHFDKKITRAHPVAIIHSPFRLSQFVPDPVKDQRLIEFTNSHWNTFRQYVREAARLGH